MIRGTCEFCNQHVTTGQKAAYRIRGWEVERDAGGANHILGRERQANRIAHAHCVTRAVKLERRGISREQMEL